MKKANYRINDNPEIWSKLPRKADDALDYLFQKLIEENEKIAALADKKDCGPFDEPVRKKVSRGQEILLLLYRLDSQILNGGVTQFCWNSPLEINDVAKAIGKLRQAELAQLYKKMDARLEENSDDWEDLWVKGHEAGAKKGWEFFQKTYSLLNLGWFDKAYMKKHRAKMVKALLEFVLKHKTEFVQ
jgi:hypothetical protein